MISLEILSYDAVIDSLESKFDLLSFHSGHQLPASLIVKLMKRWEERYENRSLRIKAQYMGIRQLDGSSKVEEVSEFWFYREEVLFKRLMSLHPVEQFGVLNLRLDPLCVYYWTSGDNSLTAGYFECPWYVIKYEYYQIRFEDVYALHSQLISAGKKVNSEPDYTQRFCRECIKKILRHNLIFDKVNWISSLSDISNMHLRQQLYRSPVEMFCGGCKFITLFTINKHNTLEDEFVNKRYEEICFNSEIMLRWTIFFFIFIFFKHDFWAIEKQLF